MLVPYVTPFKAFNLCKCVFSYVLRKECTKGFPAFLKLEPASICNLHCYGCRTGRDEDLVDLDPGVLNINLFMTILTSLKPYLFEIGFYLWGEPFINYQLTKMISLAHRANIATIVSTNLHFMDMEVARQLVRSRLDRLIVSIDGMSERSYGAVRAGGRIERVLANLSLLLKARKELRSRKPVIEWQFVVTKDNKSDIGAAMNYAKSHGIDFFTLMPDWGRRGDNPELVEARRKDRAERQRGCKWLWFAVAIQWNGEVYPCCHSAKKKEWAFEKFVNSSLADLWNGEKYMSSRTVFRRINGIGRDKAGTSVCYKCPMI
jgi:radical SAM protein with 4Fe4S-binding SPASM domain